MKKHRRTSDVSVSVEVDVNKLIAFSAIAVMSILLFLSVFFYLRQFMRVSRFEVSGDSPYEKSELIVASGINVGDKLYGADYKDIEKKMMSECPYLEKINVTGCFPNKVKFSVESVIPAWYIEISGDYYALDSSLKVLEETKNGDKFVNGGICRLTLPNVKSAMLGQTLVYGSSEEEIAATKDIMYTLKSTGLRSRITYADIDNRFDIHLEIDGAYSVSIGTYSSLEVKLKSLENVLASDRMKDAVGGEIDISDSASMISVRPVYSYGGDGEETEAQETAANGE